MAEAETTITRRPSHEEEEPQPGSRGFHTARVALSFFS
jgi:hypothetical protein